MLLLTALLWFYLKYFNSLFTNFDYKILLSKNHKIFEIFVKFDIQKFLRTQYVAYIYAYVYMHATMFIELGVMEGQSCRKNFM